MTISPIRSVSGLLLIVLTLCTGALSLSTGCESPPDFRNMTAVEKAKAISSRRKQARYELAAWEASAGEDIEALKRYAALHVETTNIAPGSCDLCFYNAGLALALVGSYYRTEVLLLDRRRLQTEDPAEAAAIEAQIEETIKTMRGHFLESNRYFESYVRQAGAIANPRAYWRLIDNYTALEDWRRALSYLDLFEQVQPLAEGNEVPAIREDLEMKLRLQEERELDEELKRSGGNRRLQKPQMAN